MEETNVVQTHRSRNHSGCPPDPNHLLKLRQLGNTHLPSPSLSHTSRSNSIMLGDKETKPAAISKSDSVMHVDEPEELKPGTSDGRPRPSKSKLSVSDYPRRFQKVIEHAGLRLKDTMFRSHPFIEELEQKTIDDILKNCVMSAVDWVGGLTTTDDQIVLSNHLWDMTKIVSIYLALLIQSLRSCRSSQTAATSETRSKRKLKSSFSKVMV